MQIEAKLEELGLVLPEPLKAPPGMRLPFAPVRIRGNRAYIAGHGPPTPDGSFDTLLGSLKRALGDLDRVTAWLKVLGMVNSAPGFTQQPSVINGFSDLILELYGAEAGQHARSAVGMAELPVGIPVEIEAEVEISITD